MSTLIGVERLETVRPLDFECLVSCDSSELRFSHVSLVNNSSEERV